MKKLLLLNVCIVSLMAAELSSVQEVITTKEQLVKDLKRFNFRDADIARICDSMGELSQYKDEKALSNALAEKIYDLRAVLDPAKSLLIFQGGRLIKGVLADIKLEKRKDVMRRKLDERKAIQAAQQIAQVGDNTSSKKSVEQIMAELGLTDYKAGKAKGKKK
jgi:hypothetical protein